LPDVPWCKRVKPIFSSVAGEGWAGDQGRGRAKIFEPCSRFYQSNPEALHSPINEHEYRSLTRWNAKPSH